MLGWITRILKDIADAATAVEKWVLKLIHSVYSHILGLLHDLRLAVNDVWNALKHFATSIAKFADRIYTFAKWIVTKLVPSVVHWALKELDKVWHYLAGFGKWVAKWIARLANDIVSAIKNVTKWVIQNIYDPLKNDFLTAWHWITHEGQTIWHLITHPELLASMLASYIWSSWLSIGRKYSKPIARWLINSMPSMVGEVTKLMEDFIANLL